MQYDDIELSLTNIVKLPKFTTQTFLENEDMRKIFKNK